ncbi:MAG: hypothetical protein DRP08_01505 [Candidatus Aenigmatarchaeota archaeon]|nr:MAG: hypothetical protein DRP08_01505 [Candidatus Aenigmarchaeota archaeon]
MKNHVLPQAIQAALNVVSRHKDVKLVAFTVEWDDREGMYIIRLCCRGDQGKLLKMWGEASNEVAKATGDMRRYYAVIVEPIFNDRDIEAIEYEYRRRRCLEECKMKFNSPQAISLCVANCMKRWVYG